MYIYIYTHNYIFNINIIYIHTHSKDVKVHNARTGCARRLSRLPSLNQGLKFRDDANLAMCEKGWNMTGFTGLPHPNA
jgi:hypothetical protein